MASKSITAISVTAADAAPLSLERKRFNTLIKEVEKMRRRMLDWQEVLPKLRQIADQEILPMASQYDDYQRQLVILFDQAYEHKSMGVRNKEKLDDLIYDKAADLLEIGDDPEIQRIFEKHSTPVKDEEEDLDLIQVLTDDLSEESLTAFLQAMSGGTKEAQPKPLHKAPAKPTIPNKSEQRLAAEQARIKQSVREIYRKLASALHPDREQDPGERARKTALMQRVNVAYKKNDVLALLELQLQIEQIDQAHMDGLSEERIAGFNRVLRTQVNELGNDLYGIERAVTMEWQLSDIRVPRPKATLTLVQKEAKQMRDLLAETAASLEAFRDIKQLKAWLKTYEPPPDFDEEDWRY